MVVCIRDWCTLGCMDNNGLCEACERTSCDRYCTGGGETLREEIKLVFTKIALYKGIGNLRDMYVEG